MTFRRSISSLALSAVLGLGACYGTTTVRGHAYVATPQLEYIGPDVQVVSDYDAPVFYSQSYYWRYDNGIWLRSSYHDRGFARVTVVPRAVLSIQTPGAYVHYHARVRANRVPRDHRY
jgi:hypothetical protein